MIGLILLVILPYKIVLSTNCNEKPCPSEKPYCSQVGCIFECPEPFYINGSDCVSDCGELFVDENRKCIVSCPDQTFFKETLKQTFSKPYIERKCIKCSTNNLLISNASCVNVCPSESRNIEENYCVSKCSDDRRYKAKHTFYGLIHYECTRKCPAVEDDGICTRFCPIHKVEFNNSCYEQCPKQSPYLLQSSCSSQCPHYAPALGYYNKSCTQTKCPDERPFVFNNTCVDNCPDSFPVINSTFNNFRYCIKDCGDKYMFKNNCEDACPSQTVAVENTCVESCPMNTSYICIVAVGSKCGEKYSGRPTHVKCVKECPMSMLILNDTCMFSCQDGLSTFGSNCLEKCPADKPYLYNNKCVGICPNSSPVTSSTFNNNKGFIVCLKDCENKYRFKNNCVDACPSQTVAVENTCVESCPMYTSYLCIVAVGSKCGEPTSGKRTHAICVNECPLSMLILNNTCIFACPSGQSIFGNECTEKCPPDSPYEQNKTSAVDCVYYRRYCKTIKKVLTCVKECSSESYIYKHSCLPYCPTNLLYSGRFCVPNCPNAKPYIKNSTVTVETWSYTRISDYYYNYHYHYVYDQKKEYKHIQECVPACGPGMIRLNSSCVKSCPDEYEVNGNGTCTKGNCDSKYKEATKLGIVCLEKCRSNTFSLNNTCVETCTGTDMKFHFNGTCVEKCPKGYNIVFFSVAKKGNILLNNCTKYCGEEYFLYNGTCVNFCEPPLLTFENTCVEECPINASFYLTSSVSFTNRSMEKDGKNIRYDNLNKTILKCEASCLNNTVALGTKCVHKCPLNRRFIVNGSCLNVECNTKYRFYQYSGIRCYDECPKDLFVSNSTCVLQCSENQFVFNQKCVNFCPPTHAIIDNKFFPKDQVDCSAQLCASYLVVARVCSESCPRNKFLHNNECKNICPEDTVTHTNKCIEVCPKSHPNIEEKDILVSEWHEYGNNWNVLYSKTYTIRECVFQCSEKHPLQFRNSCISNCPTNFPYQTRNTCVKACPRNKLTDLSTKKCVDKCAQTYGEFNRSCYTNCPKHIRYIFAARCVSECLSSYPVALEEDRFVCRKSCGDSKLFKDGKCVNSFECDDPMLEYNGLCLHRCPEGFVWFTQCSNIAPAKVGIVALVMLLGLLFSINRQTILDFIQTARLLFISEEMIKAMEKKLIYSSCKSKLNGERRVLEDETELLPNMVEETVV